MRLWYISFQGGGRVGPYYTRLQAETMQRTYKALYGDDDHESEIVEIHD